MGISSEGSRTVGLRVVSGGGDLAARVSLDYDQRLFRRNYRVPILVSAALVADADDLGRWLTGGSAADLGRDVAARVLNRIASEAAEPLFLHAVVAGGSSRTQEEIRRGVADACVQADCTFLSGADASTWDRKVMIAVSATGVVERSRMMNRRRFEAGDVVLAIGSDRLWPSLVKAAGRAVSRVKSWPQKNLGYDAAEALTRPAPVLAGHLQAVLRRYRVKRVVHAMVPVEADGLAPAIDRLTAHTFDIKRQGKRRNGSPLLALLSRNGLDIRGIDEGHARGIGYLMVVSAAFAASITKRLRRFGLVVHPFGRLVAGDAS
jgi:phosphoribosylformylglycinamidine cyclo-ligase